jgi:single-strand DNA-binding protein
MSLNRVTLIGHLGQDPELRHLPTSGQPVASFSIATDEAYTDKQGQRQERVDWHNIVVFGKAAESCKEYLKKGREVYIEGRLRIREFEAKDNGGKRQRAEIIANRVQFLGARPAEAKATAEVEGDLASDDAPFSGYLQDARAEKRGHFPAPRAVS